MATLKKKLSGLVRQAAKERVDIVQRFQSAGIPLDVSTLKKRGDTFFIGEEEAEDVFQRELPKAQQQKVRKKRSFARAILTGPQGILEEGEVSRPSLLAG